MKTGRLQICYGLVLVIGSVAAYWGTIDNGFVAWDDLNYLVDNPHVWGLSTSNFLEIFTGFRNGNYHPLPLFSYALEYELYGLTPGFYHAMSIIWHAANAVLAFVLLRALGLNPGVAFATSLLYAIHPMRVEAVAWVTGRKDLMATFFSLGAILAHVTWVKSGRRRWYWVGLALFLMALGSKGTAMVLPLLLLLVDRMMGRRTARQEILEKWPHVVFALLFALIAFWARASFQDILNEARFGPLYSLETGIYRLVFYYLARTIIPVPHLVPQCPPLVGLDDPWVTSAILICIAFVVMVIRMKWFSSHPVMGFWFFLLAIVPALFLPVVGYSADRFAYFPSIGLAYSLGWSLERAGRHWNALWRQRIGPAALVAVSAVLLGLTISRCEIWRDSVALFSDAIALFEGRDGQELNLARTYVTRGMAHRENGKIEEALADFLEATQAGPELAHPWLLLAETQLEIGDAAAAVASYSRFVQIDPENPAAWLGRCVAYVQLGELPRALADAEQALRLAPNDPDGFNTRGLVWKEMGRHDAALYDFNRVIELVPQDPVGYLNRGFVLASLGERELATRDFSTVLRHDPENRPAREWLESRERSGDR